MPTDQSSLQDATRQGDAAPPSTGDGGGEYLRIEQVALKTGFTKRTLRYYEELGLLPPPTRTEGGYRLYSPEDVAHLQRIKRLKDLLGFSLKEIREIAQAEEEREHVAEAWRRETDPAARLAWLDRVEELTRRQLQMVEEKLAGLGEMRHNLLARLERYERSRGELRSQMKS